MSQVVSLILSNFVGLCFAGVSAFAGYMISANRKQATDNNAIKDGVCALLRDRLIQKCKYHIKQECADENDRADIQRMYKAYHQLGGNDVVTALVRKVTTELPLNKEEKES